MHELAVTAIGKDRPGIVAAVTKVLHERGGNLEDSAMTILGGQFAIVLLVATEDDPEELRQAVRSATAEFDLTISICRADAARADAEPTHLLSVYGADRPGIVAGVTGALAEAGANVIDLETQVIGAGAEPVYAMLIELATDAPDAVTGAVARACAALGVDHTLRAVDTETY